MLSGNWDNEIDLMDLVALISKVTGDTNKLFFFYVKKDSENDRKFVLKVLKNCICHEN